MTQPDAELRCYVCGVNVGEIFNLVHMGSTGTSVFVFCDGVCPKRAKDAVSIIKVQRHAEYKREREGA